IQVTGSNGNAIPGSFAFTNNDQLLLFTPNNPYPADTVTVTVPSSVTGLTGIAATPYSFYFTVDSPVDTAPPNVIAINPPSGATAVGRNVTPGYTFDKRVDALTVAPALEVYDKNTLLTVAGAATVSSDRKSVVFQPTAQLTGNTTYCTYF